MAVASRLFLPSPPDLTKLPLIASRGFGGVRQLYRARMDIAFAGDSGELTYRHQVHIPAGAGDDLPSVLGMDFIEHFRLTVAAREGLVQLEPLF